MIISGHRHYQEVIEVGKSTKTAGRLSKLGLYLRDLRVVFEVSQFCARSIKTLARELASGCLDKTILF